MDDLTLPLGEVRRLLGAGSGDAALLYLYLKTGAPPAAAAEALHLPAHRADAALASLRQLGLWEEARDRPVVRSQPPVYTEADVLRATERGQGFSLLVGEAQRRLLRHPQQHLHLLRHPHQRQHLHPLRLPHLHQQHPQPEPAL